MNNTMNEIEKARLEFEKALELRNFEISNFWKRSWFFGALLLAAVSGYFGNISQEAPLAPPVCISFLIMLITLSQCLMGRGSKYWQERWVFITRNRESKLGIDLTKTRKYDGNERYYIDKCIVAKRENLFTRAQRFSVSKLTFLVWDIIFLASLFLWLNDTCKVFAAESIDRAFAWKIIAFHSVIGAYILIFFLKGKVFENIGKTTAPDGKIGEGSDEDISNRYINDNVKTLPKRPGRTRRRSERPLSANIKRV